VQKSHDLQALAESHAVGQDGALSVLRFGSVEGVH